VLWKWVGIVNGGKRDYTAAVDAFGKAITLGDSAPDTRCYYVHALARAGRRPDALRILSALEAEGISVAPSFLAIAHLGLGNRARALEYLETGFGARDPLLQYIVVESYLDAIMDDPRFQKIVAGMGLPLPRRS
jgi:hypothetical protein